MIRLRMLFFVFKEEKKNLIRRKESAGENVIDIDDWRLNFPELYSQLVYANLTTSGTRFTRNSRPKPHRLNCKSVLRLYT